MSGTKTQITGISEDTKQDKCLKTTPLHIIFKAQKIKEKILKEARGGLKKKNKNQLTYRRTRLRHIQVLPWWSSV